MNNNNINNINNINNNFIRYNNNNMNFNFNNPMINYNFIRNNNGFNNINFNNLNQGDNGDKNKEKKDNNNNIKYSWLKKEIFTQEIINNKKDDYECTICLENIILNQDINILKCGHIFHYKCIENLVDHKIKRCPNCRCDLKTGEKQSNNLDNSGIFSDFDFDLLSYNFDDDDDFLDIHEINSSFHNNNYDWDNMDDFYEDEDEDEDE